MVSANLHDVLVLVIEQTKHV